ncbi:hypothetical protein B0H34DRAFT_294187 [Crassisporium funariophilum]|nr:hypothetical protein B0H34DRAFT_294187 [Crassisporium funariophilum]
MCVHVEALLLFEVLRVDAGLAGTVSSAASALFWLRDERLKCTRVVDSHANLSDLMYIGILIRPILEFHGECVSPTLQVEFISDGQAGQHSRTDGTLALCVDLFSDERVLREAPSCG